MKLSELKSFDGLMLEMANLYPSDTGVDYVMWFGEVGGQHGPRIKVSNQRGRFATNDNFTLTVAASPEVATPPSSVGIKQSELNTIIKWIRINYDDLMKLWQIHETGNAITLPDGQILNAATILSRLEKV